MKLCLFYFNEAIRPHNIKYPKGVPADLRLEPLTLSAEEQGLVIAVTVALNTCDRSSSLWFVLESPTT